MLCNSKTLLWSLRDRIEFFSILVKNMLNGNLSGIK